MPNFTIWADRLKFLTKMIGFTTLEIITLFHYPVNNGKVNKEINIVLKKNLFLV